MAYLPRGQLVAHPTWLGSFHRYVEAGVYSKDWAIEPPTDETGFGEVI